MAKKKPAEEVEEIPPELVEAFGNAFDKLPEEAVEQRNMFGDPSDFVNRNMCCGPHEENCIARLDESERENALSKHDAAHFEPIGRRMREYIAPPPAITGNPRKFNH